MLIAMSTNQTLWWITLAVGLVVAVVVWLLLERLRRSVDEVDREVDAVWTMGKRVAQNTSTTYLLGATHQQGAALLEELEEHRTAMRRGGP